MSEAVVNPGRLVRPAFERHDGRGSLVEVLNDGAWRSVLCGTMHAGAVMGNHYHRETLVFFHLVTGAALVKIYHVESGVREELRMGAMDGVLFRLWETHAITFTADSSFLLLKDRTYDPARNDTYPYPIPGPA